MEDEKGAVYDFCADWEEVSRSLGRKIHVAPDHVLCGESQNALDRRGIVYLPCPSSSSAHSLFQHWAITIVESTLVKYLLLSLTSFRTENDTLPSDVSPLSILHSNTPTSPSPTTSTTVIATST